MRVGLSSGVARGSGSSAGWSRRVCSCSLGTLSFFATRRPRNRDCTEPGVAQTVTRGQTRPSNSPRSAPTHMTLSVVERKRRLLTGHRTSKTIPFSSRCLAADRTALSLIVSSLATGRSLALDRPRMPVPTQRTQWSDLRTARVRPSQLSTKQGRGQRSEADRPTCRAIAQVHG